MQLSFPQYVNSLSQAQVIALWESKQGRTLISTNNLRTSQLDFESQHTNQTLSVAHTHFVS